MRLVLIFMNSVEKMCQLKEPKEKVKQRVALNDRYLMLNWFRASARTVTVVTIFR